MRICLLILACLAATPLLAETAALDTHLSEVEGLRVLHVWTSATKAGTDALVYLQIENTSAVDAVLTGGTAEGHALELVGFSYGSAGEAWTVLPGLPVPAGATLHLEPKVLALRWSALADGLTQGADLDIQIAIGGHSLKAEVEIGAADATAHSHAGHDH